MFVIFQKLSPNKQIATKKKIRYIKLDDSQFTQNRYKISKNYRAKILSGDKILSW